MLFELILIVGSPNIYFDEIYVVASRSFNNYEITFELNVLLLPLLLIRLYKPLKLVLYLNRYYDFRASRVSAMLGQSINLYFAIKCLVSKHPLKVVLINLFICIFSFSWLMHAFEGPVFKIALKESPTSLNNFTNYGNCFWFLIVTTTTIGFGDYYPITNIGRIVTVVAAIVGNIHLSILIYRTVTYFTLNEEELNLLEFASRMMAKAILDRLSAAYFRSSVQYLISRNKLCEFIDSNPLDSKYIDANNHGEMPAHMKENVTHFNKLKEDYYVKIYNRITKKRLFKSEYQ